MLLNKGFSLIEILLTLALMAIVTVFALPDYSHLFTYAQNQHLRAELQRTLGFASGMAMSRGESVTLCGADPAYQQCAEHWHDGMLVVSDNQILYVINSIKQRESYTGVHRSN